MKPKLLDLFCGAGGAGMGYSCAGFDVTGVDIKPQPRYPFPFILGDALTLVRDQRDGCLHLGPEICLGRFDAIHASPPCQAYTSLRALQTGKAYPELISSTRAALQASGKPYVIENVPGAPLGESGFLLVLCGTMFGLATPDGRAEIRRHRLFECSFCFGLRPACQHGARVLYAVGDHPHDAGQRHRARRVLSVVVGHTPVDNTFRSTRRRAMTVTGNTPQTNTVRNAVRETFTVDDARAAMGIDWMPMKALSQAVPPAYTEFIGRQLLAALELLCP